MKTLWQLPQIVLGFLVLACTRTTKVERYKGASVFRHGGRWGVSLGPIIIVSVHHDQTTIAHEYGHSIQSRLLGPLYLPVVGVPSITMNVLTRLGVLRSERYYDRWPECWADRLGGVERVPT